MCSDVQSSQLSVTQVDDFDEILSALVKQVESSMQYGKKVGDRSRGWPEGSLFDSYFTKMLGRAQLLSLYCTTLLLIHTL